MGGKATHGTAKVKTFGELVKGDNIWYIEIGSDGVYKEEIVNTRYFKNVTSPDKDDVVFYYMMNDRIRSGAVINASEVDKTTSNDGTYIYATSHKEAIKANIKYLEDKISEFTKTLKKWKK